MEKISKKLKNDAIFLLVFQCLYFIITLYNLLNNVIIKTEILTHIIKFFSILVGFILLWGMCLGAKNQKLYAGICGIIVSILLIIHFNPLDLILGVFLILHSIEYIKTISKAM